MLIFSLGNLAIAYFHIPGPLRDKKVVIFPYGSNTNNVVQKLEKNNIIRFPLLFKAIVRIYGIRHKPKSGEYIFTPYITPQQVLAVLIRGKSITHRLVIPEGYTVQQIVDELYAKPLLKGDIKDDIKEGFLFPSTYYYTYNDQRQKLIEQMRLRMSALLDELTADFGFSSFIKSRLDILTLASIVQKEALYNHEKPRIAGLYLNRIKKGMKLQADPTVIYGITFGKHKLGRPLTKKDLLEYSTYNTYRIYGLPPTPICCPGRKAIKSVIQPMLTNDLYMVTKGDGTHYFSPTYKQHSQNVRKYRQFQRNISQN